MRFSLLPLLFVVISLPAQSNAAEPPTTSQVGPASVAASASASQSIPAAARVVDCRKSVDQKVRGRLVDGSGKAVAGSTVSLRKDGRLLGQTITDREGQFAFTSPEHGVVEIATPQGVRIVRVWDHAVAPPNARDTVTLASGSPAIRGQYGGGGGLGTAVGLGLSAAGLAVSAVAVDQNNDLEDELSETRDELSQLREAVSASD